MGELHIGLPNAVVLKVAFRSGRGFNSSADLSASLGTSFLDLIVLDVCSLGLTQAPYQSKLEMCYLPYVLRFPAFHLCPFLNRCRTSGSLHSASGGAQAQGLARME